MPPVKQDLSRLQSQTIVCSVVIPLASPNPSSTAGVIPSARAGAGSGPQSLRGGADGARQVSMGPAGWGSLWRRGNPCTGRVLSKCPWKSFPFACPPWWNGCSFPSWWLRRICEGKNNPSLCLLMMLLSGHGLGGPLHLQDMWLSSRTCMVPGSSGNVHCSPACLSRAGQDMGSQGSRLLRAWQIPHPHPE